MNWNKRSTRNITRSLIHEPKPSALRMNITRSLIHEPKQALHTEYNSFLNPWTETKRATHEYNSFFNPWTERSALRMNITRFLIHKPKQAR